MSQRHQLNYARPEPRRKKTRGTLPPLSLLSLGIGVVTFGLDLWAWHAVADVGLGGIMLLPLTAVIGIVIGWRTMVMAVHDFAGIGMLACVVALFASLPAVALGALFAIFPKC